MRGSYHATSGCSESSARVGIYGGLDTMTSKTPSGEPENAVNRSAWTNLMRSHTPWRIALACATASAGAEMSSAYTVASERERASDTAMHPDPVPTSSTRGLPMSRTAWRDRKSTRLNSSHLVISYAVFCLKKKKKKLC